MATSAAGTLSQRGDTLRKYLKRPIHFGVLSKITSPPDKVLTCHVSSLLELEIHTGPWRCLLLSQPTHPPHSSAQGSTPCFKYLVFKSISLNPGQSLGNMHQSIQRMVQGVIKSSLQSALVHPVLHQDVLPFELMWFWSHTNFWSANKSFCGDFEIPGIGSSASVG